MVDQTANEVDDWTVQRRDLTQRSSGLRLAQARRTLLRLAISLTFMSAVGCSDRPLPFPLPDDGGADMTRPAVNIDPITRACTTFVACGLSDLVGTSMNYCLYDWNLLLGDIAIGKDATQQIIDCIGAAGTDCAKAASCLDHANTHQPCPGQPTCYGNAVLGCLPGSALIESFDCASVGEQCIVYDSGLKVGCGFDRCAPTGHPQARCFSNHVANCFVGMGNSGGDGIFTLLADCSVVGGTCTEDPSNGVVQCSLPSCNGSQATTCMGDFATYCQQGTLSLTDCRPYGCADGTCREASAFDCDFKASCDGAVLHVCGQSIDCVALGFAGCDSSDGGRCTR